MICSFYIIYFNLFYLLNIFRLELYFSNKQGSPEKNSQKLDFSVNEENNTIAQLQSNQQISLNTSKETDTSDTMKNNVTGKQ